MRMVAVAGAVAAAILTVGITAAVRAASAAPSPLAAVTGALARTSAQSYAFSLVTTMRTSDQMVSPSELEVVLQSAGTAVQDSGPVSGPGWTGIKYTFTASLSMTAASPSSAPCTWTSGNGSAA